MLAKRALEFLEKEEDSGVRTMLGMAFLNNFAYDGLEAVRKLIMHDTYEPFITDLQEDLIIACTIMEERKGSFFKELIWNAQDEDADHQTEARNGELF